MYIICFRVKLAVVCLQYSVSTREFLLQGNANRNSFINITYILTFINVVNEKY